MLIKGNKNKKIPHIHHSHRQISNYVASFSIAKYSNPITFSMNVFLCRIQSVPVHSRLSLLFSYFLWIHRSGEGRNGTNISHMKIKILSLPAWEHIFGNFIPEEEVSPFIRTSHISYSWYLIFYAPWPQTYAHLMYVCMYLSFGEDWNWRINEKEEKNDSEMNASIFFLHENGFIEVIWIVNVKENLFQCVSRVSFVPFMKAAYEWFAEVFIILQGSVSASLIKCNIFDRNSRDSSIEVHFIDKIQWNANIIHQSVVSASNLSQTECIIMEWPISLEFYRAKNFGTINS